METDFHCIISPRHGHNSGKKSPLPYICSESSVSPASTLSDENYNKHKNILNYQPSYVLSSYRNQSETTVNSGINIDQYKQKLKALNSLLSPMKLFHEIDLMIKNYHALKKEYCLQWELQQLYRQQIRSMLKQNKSNANLTQFKPKSYIMPLHDVEELIKRLQNIQFSIKNIFQNFCNKHTSKTPNKSTQHLNIFFQRSPRNAKTITPRQNIKSIKKRPSASSVHPFSKRKKTKQKLKSDKKTVKNDNYGKYNLHRIKDYDYADAYINNNDNNNKNNKNNTLCPSPLQLTCNTSYANTFLPLPQSKSRRRSSIRSFGSLYSDEFRNSVASDYKNRMRLHDEFKQHDDYLGLTQLKIVEFYHNDYIGQNELFESPFGIRPIIYCDWTASGKALHCVENYINNEMLPLYANTHTTTSITGIQTSKFRSEARSIILESIGGDTNEDVIIFTGNGTTAAIYKIANVLMKQNGYKPANTVVFISIYEHNSNIFIWKELGCKVIVIPECNNNNNSKGGLDLNVLEKHLKFYTSTHMKHKYNLLIGSFSAASNVSGIIAPVDECTLLLKRYNCLSFWDYATAGPYMNVNMTNKQNHMLSKDAIFISPHKYLGGPGSPGILCAKKKLFLNHTPVVPGGGTVFIAYGVNDGQWEYLDNIEEREEGGTPDIIGSIRASFAFMIKDHLTTEFIENRENEYLKYFFKHCKSICNLVIMGNNECKRLPVISFLITHTKNGFGAAKKTKYLHYNFIAALMNDLFGIQGRGGCACAGMYGKYVLNMSMNQVDHIVEQLRSNKNELSRPGYFRINLHYTLTKNELNYIINAIKFVCNKGWLFLPLYDVDIESGNYFHRDTKLQKQLHSLLDISFNTNQMKWKKKKRNNKSFKGKNLNKYFEIADNIILNLNEYLPNINQFKNDTKICDETAWYWIPSELYQAARNYTQ